jgi:branched-chain amino acid transport system ATP-binding protein
MLRVIDIHTYYGSSYILQGISTEVQRQTVVAILGRNGMGKTTLMHSLIGIVKPRQGSVIFNDEDITPLESYKIVRKGISLVPQGRQIFPSLTVEENLKVASLGTREIWNIGRIYELFPPLKLRAHHMGNRLSGGEQQMLAVGRSLMTNPLMLLMDEPTEGLAPIYVQIIGRILQELLGNGISILFVEQNLPFALRNATFIHIMSKGKIVHSASPTELEADHEVRQRHLGV